MTSFIAPSLGCVTGFSLSYSATPGLLRDRSSGNLTTDPLPYPISMICNLLWIMYGSIIQDGWIVLGNFIALGGTSFNALTVLQLCRSQRTTRVLESILYGGVLLVAASVALLASPLVVSDAALRQTICGGLCVAIILIMYGSPALAAVQALRTGDASAVSLPLALGQLANGLLWGVYGMALGDVVVFGPNLLGAALAGLNLTAKIVSKPQPAAEYVAVPTPIDLLHVGGEIRVRSLYYSQYVSVQASDDGLDALGTGLCVSPNGGSVLRAIPLEGHAERRFALSTQDGRYLSVAPQTESVRTSHLPSTLRIVVTQREEPGPEGEFVAVACPAKDADEHGSHQYSEDGLGLWNPLHKVFLRTNEYGFLDCSSQCHPSQLGLAMPKGWEWERFTVHAATIAEVMPAPIELGRRRLPSNAA